MEWVDVDCVRGETPLIDTIESRFVAAQADAHGGTVVVCTDQFEARNHVSNAICRLGQRQGATIGQWETVFATVGYFGTDCVAPYMASDLLSIFTNMEQGNVERRDAERPPHVPTFCPKDGSWSKPKRENVQQNMAKITSKLESIWAQSDRPRVALLLSMTDLAVMLGPDPKFGQELTPSEWQQWGTLLSSLVDASERGLLWLVLLVPHEAMLWKMMATVKPAMMRKLSKLTNRNEQQMRRDALKKTMDVLDDSKTYEIFSNSQLS